MMLDPNHIRAHFRGPSKKSGELVWRWYPDVKIYHFRLEYLIEELRFEATMWRAKERKKTQLSADSAEALRSLLPAEAVAHCTRARLAASEPHRLFELPGKIVSPTSDLVRVAHPNGSQFVVSRWWLSRARAGG